MAKANKAKKEKTVKKAKATQRKIKASYYGFNVTLKSNERKGDIAYGQLINALANVSYIKISLDKAVTLRTKFVTNVTINGTASEIHYGRITRFTLLEGTNWYNLQRKDFEKFQPPANMYPNAAETDYIFIPVAHRFFIKLNGKVSAAAAGMFLTQGFKQVATDKEQISVSIIQSGDIIERIIESEAIKSLKIVVSYTNDDIGDEADEFVDALLKKANIGHAEVNFKPDQTGSLNAGSQLVSGLLGVAKENGEAEATIVNANGKKEKVITSQHPEKFTIEAKDDDDAKNVLAKEIIEKYRNDNADNEPEN